MASLDFNAEEVDPMQDLSPVPVGEYVAQIVESEMKDTASGTGRYLKLSWQILDDGPHQSRRVWVNLNLENPNQQAVEIARRELSSICRAVGVLRPADSSELHEIACRIKVGIDNKDKDRNPQNKINAYLPLADDPQQAASAPARAPSPRPAAAAPARQPVGAGAGGGAGSPPWKRK
jgi:hypothetical protein